MNKYILSGNFEGLFDKQIINILMFVTCSRVKYDLYNCQQCYYLIMNLKLLQIIFTFILHIQTLNHSLYKLYRSNTYLDALQNIQNIYSQQIRSIQQNITIINSNINQNLTNSTHTIQLLKSQLQLQRNWITSMENIINFPFQHKLCKCINLTESNKIPILQNIQNLQQSIKTLQKQIQTCQKCNRNQLILQISKQSNYVNSLKDIISSDCCSKNIPQGQSPVGLVNLNLSSYIHNINSPNWIYGNITSDQYKLQLFNIVSKKNTTKCKFQTPFAISNTQCIQCSGTAPIFNFDLNKCVQCPPNTRFNNDINNCSLNGINPPYISNLDETQWIYGNLKLQDFQNYRLSKNNFVKCSKNNPFAKGENSCLNCGIQQVWNLFNQTCMKCPSGTTFDVVTHQCITFQNLYTNLSAPKLLSPNIAFSDQKKKLFDLGVYKNNSKVIACPPNLPYYDGKSCIRCNYSIGQLFNLENKKCQKCKNGYIYTQSDHNCTQAYFMLNTNAINILETKKSTRDIINKQIQQLQKNQSINIVICEIETPFTQNNLDCFECALKTPIFNLQSRVCQKCTQGTIYNPVEKKCKVSIFFTNPQAPKLYLKETKIQYDVQQQKIISACKNANKNCTSCPINTPYFNGLECISCNTDQIFDANESKKCLKCLGNFIYSPKNYDCIPLIVNAPKPSIERMIMNIQLF